MPYCSNCAEPYEGAPSTCGKCGASLATIGGGADGPLSFSFTIIEPGTTLHSGDYVIKSVLGQGGFGITYLGEEPRLRRLVAIKEFFLTGYCLRVDGTVQPVTGAMGADTYRKARENFYQEGQRLAQFSHESIVDIYNSFEENGTAYMVMEFLEGKTLQNLVASDGPLPTDRALRFFDELADALSVVHDAGMLHLDIKPDNIIICRNDRAVLIDFGISREYAANVTQTNLGFSPGYAPPEQHGSRAHHRPTNDFYSLGATMYYAVTGRTPYSAVDRQTGVELPNPRAVNPSVPEHISKAVMWAMELSPEARPQKIEDFRSALAGSREAPTSDSKQQSGSRTSAFRFAGGDVAYTADELIGLLDGNWEESKKHLNGGNFQQWLSSIGRGDLALAAAEAVKECANTDEALEKFVQSTGLLPPPEPRVQPDKLSYGRVEAGSYVREAGITVQNAGRGYLAGTVQSSHASISVVPSLISGNQIVLKVSMDPTKIDSGRNYTHKLTIDTNALKRISVPVDFAVSFPWSKLLWPIIGWSALGLIEGLYLRFLYQIIMYLGDFRSPYPSWGIPSFRWEWILQIIGGFFCSSIWGLILGVRDKLKPNRGDAFAALCVINAFVPIVYIPLGLLLEWLIAPSFSRITSNPYYGWALAFGVSGFCLALGRTGKTLQNSAVQFAGYGLMGAMCVLMFFVSVAVGVTHIPAR